MNNTEKRGALEEENEEGKQEEEIRKLERTLKESPRILKRYESFCKEIRQNSDRSQHLQRIAKNFQITTVRGWGGGGGREEKKIP